MKFKKGDLVRQKGVNGPVATVREDQRHDSVLVGIKEKGLWSDLRVDADTIELADLSNS